ncbi:peptidylprolyl isomerase [Nocardioides panzhihuensis]|uniref:Peptidyl-prolyl cis-trans isomerase B (Cyclophilin B) n=1 Tax=Nocardioides panzhihuensis TaxID=860243 RepID=A0A7Z0DL59_9ACTN|nr:peptidylprolyl isomerase [Nocardioides panzhihuensis]NYI77281.1 peptidyl-prolyl cis-trans isomerase B (cyclophilin B) [Nocardioides panzhihuensis]
MLTHMLSATAAAALLLTLSACGSDSSSDSPGSGDAKESKGPKSSESSDWKSIVKPGTTSCDYVEDPMGASKEVDAPEKSAQYTGKVAATINTSVGPLAVTLDADKAPCTVNSFLSLASQDYYDGTSCHRLGANPGFELLQCGDPTGQGTGGPGYTIPDEFEESDTFPAGTLAMANTGQPNTGGSQFFMVFGDTQLPPSYTVFGTLDEAAIKALQEVGEAGVAEAGADGTGAPKKPVEFETITVG